MIRQRLCVVTEKSREIWMLLDSTKKMGLSDEAPICLLTIWRHPPSNVLICDVHYLHDSFSSPEYSFLYETPIILTDDFFVYL